MFCKNCGREQKNNERFCAQCGTPYATIGNNTVPPIPSINNGLNVATSPMNNTGVQQQTSAAHLFIGKEGEKRCPNCGANYTNTQNCEYCGSLLVRFVEKHIEIDEKKYGATAEKIKGLEDALKENLQEQDDTEGYYHVTTRIEADFLNVPMVVCNSKAITDFVKLDICGKEFKTVPLKQFNDESKSLQVCFRFLNITKYNKTIFDDENYISKKEALSVNTYNQNLLEKFSRMKEFPLFNLYEEELINYSGYVVGTLNSYYINFGCDYKGAAAIITQYMREVLDVRALKKQHVEFSLISKKDEEYDISANKNKNAFVRRMRIAMWACIIIGLIGIPMLINAYNEGDVEGIIVSIIGILFFGVLGTVMLRSRIKQWNERNSR